MTGIKKSNTAFRFVVSLLLTNAFFLTALAKAEKAR